MIIASESNSSRSGQCKSGVYQHKLILELMDISTAGIYYSFVSLECIRSSHPDGVSEFSEKLSPSPVEQGDQRLHPPPDLAVPFPFLAAGMAVPTFPFSPSFQLPHVSLPFQLNSHFCHYITYTTALVHRHVLRDWFPSLLKISRPSLASPGCTPSHLASRRSFMFPVLPHNYPAHLLRPTRLRMSTLRPYTAAQQRRIDKNVSIQVI